MFHVKTGFRCYCYVACSRGFHTHRISEVYRLLSHLTLYDVQLLSREIGGRRGHFDFHLSQITPHVRGRDANPRTPTASNALRRR